MPSTIISVTDAERIKSELRHIARNARYIGYHVQGIEEQESAASIQQRVKTIAALLDRERQERAS